MRWRTAGRMTATVLVALVVAGAVVAVGIAGAIGEIYTPRRPQRPAGPGRRRGGAGARPGEADGGGGARVGGANAADVLAPYEGLAATGAFNLYTLAPQRQPVPLAGNMDVVPDLMR
jgi:hypothetical protein